MLKHRQKKCLKQNNAGFSLVEIVVAVAILAIVTIPLLKIFVTSAQLNAKSKERQQITAAAGSVMEEIKSTPLVDLSGVSVSPYYNRGQDPEYKYDIKAVFAPLVTEPLVSQKPIDEYRDAVYREESGLNIVGYNSCVNSLVDWMNEHDEFRDYNLNDLSDSVDVSRNITISFSKDFLGHTKGVVTVTYSATVKNSLKYYANSTGTSKKKVKDAPDNPGTIIYPRPGDPAIEYLIFDNSSTGASLDNAFIFFFPAYKKHAGLNEYFVNDTINIANTTGSPVNVYLVKQKREISSLNTCEQSYTPSINTSGDGALYHNLGDNISGASTVSWVPGAYYHGSFANMGSANLVNKENRTIMYKVKLYVYKAGEYDTGTPLYEMDGTR